MRTVSPPRESRLVTVYADLRTGPPPRACGSCDASLAGCDGKRMLSGRPCCTDCQHPTTPKEWTK